MKQDRAIIAALLLSVAPAGCADGDTEGAACDRACIVRLTNRYLCAVARRDPSAAPLAPDVAFVENLQRMTPGEGLWQTATGGESGFEKGRQGIYVPDPELQQSGWIGVIERDGKPMLLALRLKLEGRQVTEAEHLIAAPVAGSLDNLARTRPGQLSLIPADQRLSHAELMRIGDSYYDALDENDGSLAPFAADCRRIANGAIIAGAGQVSESGGVAKDCAGQISSQTFVYIDRIENRRMVAADRATGLVFGMSHFRHPMDNLPYKVTLADGSTAERNPRNMPHEPFDMPAAHIFRIGPDGQIHEIEAVGVVAPYDAPTGWE